MNERKIAIIGMDCRVPGANNVKEYWSNLCHGVDSIKKHSNTTRVKDEDRYVGATGHIEKADFFDAEFFGYTPREAGFMDPQHRIFLETAWTALEFAGYNPQNHQINVGLFAGCSVNKYFLYHLYPYLLQNQELGELSGDELPVGTTPDYLTSRIAYKLGFRGPCLSIQSTCASSLVSVCMACQSLADYRCDMALAGGVSIKLPSQKGYWAQKDGLFSRSGRCRPYDINADGSIFSSGSGVVVLKRLEDAMEHNDQIYSIIRGWAVNNDGCDRLGFTAPNVEGQASVVVEAQTDANIEPIDVTYIEGHGSGTPIGDQIEIESLKKAFNRNTKEKGFCALGSVKGNIGHTDAAAGVMGLIKTALSLKRKLIPPSINFEKPNPDMQLELSPFFVNTSSYDLSQKDHIIAGVNSFGLGGTNAHVILENYKLQESDLSNSFVLIPMSARSNNALNTIVSKIHERIKSDCNLSDLAYTMSIGRKEFPYKKAHIVCCESRVVKKEISVEYTESNIASNQKYPKITFMFPGLGGIYTGAGYELYKEEIVFREIIDYCSEKLMSSLHFDLRNHLYPKAIKQKSRKISLPRVNDSIDMRKMIGLSDLESDKNLIIDTLIAQPVCFVFEYALSKLLLAWGIKPDYMIGYSVGEYVAACLAQIFSLDDVLSIVARRARLISELGPGSMLAVPVSEEKITPYLSKKIALAAANTDDLCVLTGKTDDIEQVKSELLRNEKIIGKIISITHAFHSPLLSTSVPKLVEYIGTFKCHKPKIPFLSNVSGDWITEKEAGDPNYWGDHLTKTVRFADGIKKIISKNEQQVFIEIGPGNTLTSYCYSLSKKNKLKTNMFISTISAHYESLSSKQKILEALGHLWANGFELDWNGLYDNQKRLRIDAPTYPFERKRYWIEKTNMRFAEKEDTKNLYLEGDQEDGNDESLLNHVNTHEKNIEQSQIPRPEIDTQFVPPRNALERRLVNIWKELFGYESIGIHDNFFSLGGHSLLALQLSNKIYYSEKIELSLATILANPIISKLSDVIIQKNESANNDVKIKEKTNIDGVEHHSRIDEIVKQVIEYTLKKPIDSEEVLTKDDTLKIFPELTLIMKRNYKMNLFPNEIIKETTVYGLVNYLRTELKQHNKNTYTHVPSSIHKSYSPRDSLKQKVIFILSSVRSGSTLLRVMLAGHDDLFCPPELHILNHEDMRERAFIQKSPDRDQGLIVGLKELMNCTVGDAEKAANKMLYENWTTIGVMKHLTNLASPKLLVDKSPGYSNELTILEKISQEFPNAKYICLFRHPYSVIESVVRNRFIRLMEGGEINPYDFAEFVWQRSNSNILDFVENLNQDQYCKIKFEDLVTNPKGSLSKICKLLKISYTDQLLKPYQGRRMRDGLGDPNFLEHNSIDSKLANHWKELKIPKFLGRSARLLSKELKYELAELN